MAISHIKSNTIPDFTGTVTVFNSVGSTVTANATDIVRPSDWNSVHNHFMTLGGNTAGASTISGTNIVFQGGNNITLSQNGSTLVFSGANTVAQTVDTNKAGTGFTTTTVAGVVIAGTNDTNGLKLAVPGYITTAMLSNAATISNVNWSAGTTSQNLSNIKFADSNGISFGIGTGANSTVITGTVQTNYLTTAAQSSASNVSQVIAATNNTGGGTATLTGGVSFSNANSFTFYTSAGNAVVGSFSIPAAITTANYYFAGNTTGQSSSSAGNDQSISFSALGIISAGMSAGQIILSVPAGGGGGDGYNIVSMLTSTSGGGTLGATFSALSASVGFMAGSNITLSQTSNTINIVGPADKTNNWFEPELVGTTANISHANGTCYFRPFYLGNNLDADKAIILQQFTSQSATTMRITASVSAGNASSGTGSFGQTGTLALFSRKNTNETNADYLNIVSFSSNTYSIGFGVSASASWSTAASSATCSWTTSGALSYIKNIDGAGGVTTTFSGSSGSSTFSSTSNAANSFSSTFVASLGSLMMSGLRPLFIPMNGSFIASADLWLMHNHSTNTGSTNFASFQNIAQQNGPGFLYYATSNQAYMEYGNTAANATSNIRFGIGSYSASSNTTTAIGLTAISSMASNASLYFNIAGQTL